MEAVAHPGFSRAGNTSKYGDPNILIGDFFPRKLHETLMDPRGRQGRAHLSESKFFHFHAVFGKKFAKS